MAHLVEILALLTEDWVEAQKILELSAVSLVVLKLAAQGLVLLQGVHDLFHHVTLGLFSLQELRIAPDVLFAVTCGSQRLTAGQRTRDAM